MNTGPTTTTTTTAKPEMLVCDKCKEHGHIMYIYKQEYIDLGDKHMRKVRLFNYHSQTRHFHMYPGGTDF